MIGYNILKMLLKKTDNLTKYTILSTENVYMYLNIDTFSWVLHLKYTLKI